MSSGIIGVETVPERIALSTLFVPATRSESCAANEWVDYYDLASFGEGVPSTRRRAALGAGARTVAPGDVLLSRLVTAPRRAWVVDASHGRPQLASSDWLVLRSDRFDPIYLRHLLVSNDFHLRFEHAAARRRRRHAIAAADVAGIHIPLPCRESQERLGRALQQADALRARRQAVAARLARLAEAAATELRAVARDAGWPQVRLGALRVEGSHGGTSGIGGQGPWLLLRAANVRQDRVDPAGCTPRSARDPISMARIVVDGDLLLARPEGASGIRVAVAYPGAARWLAHEELLKLTVDTGRVHPEYLRAMLAGDAACASPVTVRARAGRSAERFAHHVEDIVVPLPPPAAQARLVALAAAAYALDAKLQASARKLDQLLGTLRDAAFRGELGG